MGRLCRLLHRRYHCKGVQLPPSSTRPWSCPLVTSWFPSSRRRPCPPFCRSLLMRRSKNWPQLCLHYHLPQPWDRCRVPRPRCCQLSRFKIHLRLFLLILPLQRLSLLSPPPQNSNQRPPMRYIPCTSRSRGVANMTPQMSTHLFSLLQYTRLSRPQLRILPPSLPFPAAILPMPRPQRAIRLLLLLLWTTSLREGRGTPIKQRPIRRTLRTSTRSTLPRHRMRVRPHTTKERRRPPITVPIRAIIRTPPTRIRRSIRTPTTATIRRVTRAVTTVIRSRGRVSTTTETIATRRRAGAPDIVTMTTREGAMPGTTPPRGGSMRGNGSRDRAAFVTKAATMGATTGGDEGRSLIYLFVACILSGTIPPMYVHILFFVYFEP